MPQNQQPESTPAVRALAAATNGLLLIATFVLTALAALLMGSACWGIAEAMLKGEDPTPQAVGSISLIIIAFAVMALSKYIAEEEIERQRELRSPREARRSLTKFMTIVVVAFSLEALVMVFEWRHEPAQTLYPTALFAIIVLALVGLGAYQWLSIQVERTAEPQDRKEEDGELARAESPHAISAGSSSGGDDDDSRNRPGHRNDGA
jgi:hypothetical protein